MTIDAKSFSMFIVFYVQTAAMLSMFWKITAFVHFRPIFGGRKCQKAHLHTKTFRLNLFTCLYDHTLQRNILESSCFKKTVVFGHFGQIRSFSVVESGQNCQKAHLHAKIYMAHSSKIWADAPAPY